MLGRSKVRAWTWDSAGGPHPETHPPPSPIGARNQPVRRLPASQRGTASLPRPGHQLVTTQGPSHCSRAALAPSPCARRWNGGRSGEAPLPRRGGAEPCRPTHSHPIRIKPPTLGRAHQNAPIRPRRQGANGLCVQTREMAEIGANSHRVSSQRLRMRGVDARKG